MVVGSMVGGSIVAVAGWLVTLLVVVAVETTVATVLTKVVATKVTVSIKLAMARTTLFCCPKLHDDHQRTLKMLKYVYHACTMMLGLGVYLQLMAAGQDLLELV